MEKTNIFISYGKVNFIGDLTHKKLLSKTVWGKYITYDIIEDI